MMTTMMSTCNTRFIQDPHWNSVCDITIYSRMINKQIDSNDFEVIEKINEKLIFVDSITVQIRRYDGHFNIDWDRAHMRLSASGETREECIEGFLEDLAGNWEYISKVPDDNLTKGALVAKKWLKNNIKEVS